VTTALRIRLTALYGTLFAAFAGAVVLAASWLFERHVDRTLPAADAQDALAQLGTQYLLAFAGATLVAVALGWALAGRELRATTDAFARQERFIANASHELRSPLTALRTEADVALADPRAGPRELRAMGEGVMEEADRMDALLDGLMLLARGVRPPAHPEPLDLARLAAGAAARLRAGGVAVRLDLDSAAVRGERRLLERLIENLLENGVRYNTRGGTLSVRTRADGGQAVLRVVNSGPVVASETAARLLEPFERGGRAGEGGAGLGLSIVRAVTGAHGGRLRLAARPEGGLAVEVALPLA